MVVTGTLGVCEWGKPIALCRFAQAIFTRFHVPQADPADVALSHTAQLPR
jgi:hypothetical protein